MAKQRRAGEPDRLIDLLSLRGRRLLAVALFLTFAPLMVVPVESEGYRLGSVIFISCVSGVMGLCYGMAFMWTIRLLPIALALHGLTFVGFGGFLPQWLWPVASGFSLTGMAAVVFVAAAYMVFVVIIAGEGQRSVRQRTELELASRIHTELTPPLDVSGEWGRAVGESRASSEMGGDLIDVIDHGDYADIVLADVAGHGVRAGVVMAMLKTALRASDQRGASLASVVASVNRSLHELTAGDLFATAWFVRIGPGGTMELVGCGHPQALVLAEGAAPRPVESSAMPLGVVGEIDTAPDRLRLQAGERLVLFSDGLSEAGVERGAMLGVDGLIAEIESTKASGLPELIAKVFERVASHAAATDDRSLMVVEVPMPV